MSTQIILGPPGCGKTHKLLDIMDDELKAGVKPERICFVSFTRKAANEAAERAAKKFNFDGSKLRYFRTLHSLAYRLLNIQNSMMMARTDWEILGDSLGVDFSSFHVTEEGLPVGGEKGDKLRFIDGFARSRLITIEEAWHEVGYDDIRKQEAVQFNETYAKYRIDHAVVDYTDMLENYVQEGDFLDVDVAFIDEAQDLSTLQWQMANLVIGDAQRVYIAGDDDQAIYKWSGADVDVFLNLDGEQEVLEYSYRLPRKIWELANTISARIKHRYDKSWLPRKSREKGVVEYISNYNNIDLTEGGTWLLLARNAYMLQGLIDMAKKQGVPYAVKGRPAYKPAHVRAIVNWELLRKGNALTLEDAHVVYDHMRSGTGIKRGYKKLKGAPTDELYTLDDLKAEWGLVREDEWFTALEAIPAEDRTYYQSVLRSGVKLTETPPVNISTIHGIKGGEADSVLLLTDLAYRTYREYQSNPDDEHRVFYVACTRARHRLYLVEPTSRFYYTV